MQIGLVPFFFARNILVRVIKINSWINFSVVMYIEVGIDFSTPFSKYIGKTTSVNYSIFYLKNLISDKLIWMPYTKMKGERLFWNHFPDFLLPYHGEGHLKLKFKKNFLPSHEVFPIRSYNTYFLLEFCPPGHCIPHFRYLDDLSHGFHRNCLNLVFEV